MLRNMKSNQLRIGTRVESEHKRTYRFISDYYKKHRKLPPREKVFKQIALDHLRERKNYYTQLKKARL